MGHAILDALDRADQPLAFLSGPSFAEEIMKGNPTTLVVASDEIFQAVRVQQMLSNFKTVRVFTSNDPVGVREYTSLFHFFCVIIQFPFSYYLLTRVHLHYCATLVLLYNDFE